MNQAIKDPAQESWRIFQILSEFVQGFEQLSNVIPAVTLFGSARMTTSHPDYQLAEDIAYKLSESGFSVISGGGPGIMEAANKGAFAGKSQSIGLNIHLPNEQQANSYQDLSLNFRHFFVRKVMLVRYASAYVVLPGGFGTLDEVTEILTLVQTQKIQPIPIILVNKTFWEGLLTWFRNKLVTYQMINPEDLDLITIADSSREVIETIFNYYEKGPIEIANNKKLLFL